MTRILLGIIVTTIVLPTTNSFHTPPIFTILQNNDINDGLTILPMMPCSLATNKKSRLDVLFLSSKSNKNEDKEDEDDDDCDEEILVSSKLTDNLDNENKKEEDKKERRSTDWMEAELSIKSFFPSEPHPDLTPHRIALAVCRSLQFVDYPQSSDGLRRIYPFLTWECRKAVTARRGGDTIDRFVEYGIHSPALVPFMGARRISMGGINNDNDDNEKEKEEEEEGGAMAVGSGTFTPGTQTRGPMASFPIVIIGSDVLTFQHSSGLIRDRVGQEPPRTDMVIRLERMRRPPLSNCWLVREILDVRYAFAGDMGNAHVGA